MTPDLLRDTALIIALLLACALLRRLLSFALWIGLGLLLLTSLPSLSAGHLPPWATTAGQWITSALTSLVSRITTLGGPR